MSLQAFGPRGNTANIACNQSASVAVQVTSSPSGCYTYQYINSGGNTAYVAASQDPKITVTIPTPGSPANGVAVLPNEIVIYNLTPNAWFSAICESGKTTNLLVTAGEGM